MANGDHHRTKNPTSKKRIRIDAEFWRNRSKGTCCVLYWFVSFPLVYINLNYPQSFHLELIFISFFVARLHRETKWNLFILFPLAPHFFDRYFKFPYENIQDVFKRRYLLQPIALEVFNTDGRNFLLVFSRGLQNKVYQRWAFYLLYSRFALFKCTQWFICTYNNK